MTLPRYPIYIPSKGRAKSSLTAHVFIKHGVPFHIVVEEPDVESYAEVFGEDRLLVLPFKDQGSVVPARNWIKDHATEIGAERHWQFDDNIRYFYKWHRGGERIYCPSGPAIAAVEDFTDRYTNIAISGLEYGMFGLKKQKPFVLNTRVYSSSLVLNSIPHRWRGRYNEDADICLQVLADGWCTVLICAFQIGKMPTMRIKGGNTTELYDETDGRLKMARALERQWPGVVKTKRRFGRPQHAIFDSWKRFDTPLIRKPDLKIDPTPNNYGLKLTRVRESDDPELKYLFEPGRDG